MESVLSTTVQTDLFGGEAAALFLDDYQDFTSTTDQSAASGADGLDLLLLGLFGEVGSLLSALKKKRRDKEAYLSYQDSVLEEFGDVLWYLASVARHSRIRLSTLATQAGRSSFARDPADLKAETFLDLQVTRSVLATADDAFERRLLVLASKVGSLLDSYVIGRATLNDAKFRSDLIDIFGALTLAADDANISLNVAALRNVEKTRSRWPTIRTWLKPFDVTFPLLEQLPRQMRMTLHERVIDGRPRAFQTLEGVMVGDLLTDNRWGMDDYRFHDVFHLAFAAILGWSPTLRKLLGRKRKSDPSIDENEDGARAILIEEGLATWIFNHAELAGHFENTSSLDYGLLKSIKDFVRGYEVSICPMWQWEQAILEGYQIFRLVRAHRGGIVTADLDSHTLTFARIEAEAFQA